MKVKITLSIVFLFFIIKIQAQIPSINETKSTRFYPNSSTLKKEKNTLIKDIKKDKKDLKNDLDSLNGLKNIDSKEIKEKISSIELAKNKIRILRRDLSYDDYETSYNTIIKRTQNSIDSLRNIIELSKNISIKDLDSKYKLINHKQQQLDSISIEKEEKLASLDKFPWIMPTWEKSNRKNFFHDMYNNDSDKTNYLNSFALNNNSDATSVQTELVTDNMWALRVSFGSVLSVSSSETNDDLTPEEAKEQNKNETEEEAFSRLINGGGNFYLETILPLFTTNQNNGDQITSYTYAKLKGAMDIENFSSNIDTSTGNVGLGFSTYLGISSDSKKFNFFVIGDINYTIGSKAFYNNLGLTEEKAFLNGKIIAGVSILNTFKLSAIINTFGSDEKLRSGKVSVGVQILP